MNKHSLIFYCIFSIIFITLIFSFVKNNQKEEEYTKAQEECRTAQELTDSAKSYMQELEMARYYLVNGFCNSKNYSGGFIPLEGIRNTNITVNCIDCEGEKCRKAESFLLR